ncbi:MAG: hypothetical protein JWO15_2471 [Sphingomonadales bacterium]|nr:hypothetical protein [Sphingomonadales bacterium]
MEGIDVGTAHMGSGPDHLKRDILFFDKVTIMWPQHAIAEWRFGRYNKARYRSYADDLEFLVDTPYFAAGGWAEKPMPLDAPETPDEKEYNEALAQFEEVSAEIERISPADGPPQSSDTNPELRNMEYLIPLRQNLIPRIEAARRRMEGASAVSILGIPKRPDRITRSKLTAGDVIQLAINRVTVPNENTSWQDILTLKEDGDLVHRANKLRSWARKIAKSESNLAEADEALSDLHADYERYLKAHKIKFSSTALKTVIVGGASLIEDIAKLKFKNLASRLFSVSEFKADLTMSEMKAPGREMSILTALEKAFR